VVKEFIFILGFKNQFSQITLDVVNDDKLIKYTLPT
jgi:hypothetical protein